MAKNDRFEVILSEGNGLTTPTRKILRDTVTGVQYLFVQDGSSAGLTVLLDKNGKPVAW